MNYNKMKKEELIKTLKERDAAIAGFEETNTTLVKQNDDIIKIRGLTDELTDIKNQLETKETDIKKLEDYNKILKTNLATEREEKADLESKLKISETTVINLKKKNELLSNNYVELTTQSSIEEANYVSRKRLYISTIILLTIGIVVLAIL